MKCQEVLTLLPIEDYGESWEKETYQKLAHHVRTCEMCVQGIVQLARAIIAENVLSCGACRTHFPGYYEATHLLYISSSIADVDIVEVAIHLGQCPVCTEQYHMLVELWDMEEQL